MNYKIKDQESGQEYEGHQIEGEQYVSFPELAQIFHIEFMYPGEQVFTNIGSYVHSFIVL